VATLKPCVRRKKNILFLHSFSTHEPHVSVCGAPWRDTWGSWVSETYMGQIHRERYMGLVCVRNIMDSNVWTAILRARNIYVHIYVHTYEHIYEYIYTYTFIHIHTYIYIYTFIGICMCMYTYTYTHTYFYIYLDSYAGVGEKSPCELLWSRCVEVRNMCYTPQPWHTLTHLITP